MKEIKNKKITARSIICFILVVCVMVPFLCSCKAEELLADVIVYADNIYTADYAGKFASAFAVKDGKYIAVGSKEEVDVYKGKSTEIYHANFVMPGATEAHGHFILEQAFKLGCYIEPVKKNGDSKTMDEIVEELVAYADSHDVSDGLYAYRFDAFKNCNLAEGTLPRQSLYNGVK